MNLFSKLSAIAILMFCSQTLIASEKPDVDSDSLRIRLMSAKDKDRFLDVVKDPKDESSLKFFLYDAGQKVELGTVWKSSKNRKFFRRLSIFSGGGLATLSGAIALTSGIGCLFFSQEAFTQLSTSVTPIYGKNYDLTPSHAGQAALQFSLVTAFFTALSLYGSAEDTDQYERLVFLRNFIKLQKYQWGNGYVLDEFEDLLNLKD